MRNDFFPGKERWMLLLIVSLGCLSFYYSDPVREAQYRMIFHNFLDSEPDAASLRTFVSDPSDPDAPGVYRKFDPEFYPDTTTIFNDSTGIGESIFTSNGRYLIRTIESSYYGSPGFTYRYTRDLVGEDYPGKPFEEKFREQFGVSPYSRILLTAKKEPWYYWSGDAVEKVFNKYYGRPENTFQHVTYGFIYKVAARNYMTDYVQLLNHLLVSKRQRWQELCEAYRKSALADPSFEGTFASSKVVDELFTRQELAGMKAMPVNYLYIPVGELMRRQIDGSLPAILRCIRIILRDYDPENYRLLRA